MVGIGEENHSLKFRNMLGESTFECQYLVLKSTVNVEKAFSTELLYETQAPINALEKVNKPTRAEVLEQIEHGKMGELE